jgi:tyrosinase
MPTIPVSPRVRRPRIRWRRSVEKLTAPQLSHVRQAYRWAESISDDRGYQAQAGIHGLPLPVSCKHTIGQQFANLFLPWHRAYLYFFERALRDEVSTLAQPWWDWTHPSPRNKGLPDAYAAKQAGGKPNPLFSVKINAVAMQQAQQAGIDLPAKVRRQPGLPGTQLPTQQQVDQVLAIPDFFTFSRVLEDLHGAVHVYVGGRTGHMSNVPLAAYDPIFWAHHSMIDRLWRMWQLRHPPPDFTADFLNTALPPFPMTVAQTLDVRALGYDYAAGTSSQAVNG